MAISTSSPDYARAADMSGYIKQLDNLQKRYEVAEDINVKGQAVVIQKIRDNYSKIFYERYGMTVEQFLNQYAVATKVENLVEALNKIQSDISIQGSNPTSFDIRSGFERGQMPSTEFFEKIKDFAASFGLSAENVIEYYSDDSGKSDSVKTYGLKLFGRPTELIKFSNQLDTQLIGETDPIRRFIITNIQTRIINSDPIKDYLKLLATQSFYVDQLSFLPPLSEVQPTLDLYASFSLVEKELLAELF